MEGVTILNTELVNYYCVGIFLFVLSFIGTILSIVLAIISFKSDDFGGGIFSIIGLCSMIVLCLMGAFAFSDSSERYEYTVTISDEVSFNEFTAKYEIIEQRGKIYVVRERVL